MPWRQTWPGAQDRTFVRWLGLRGGPMDFMPRQLYAQYIADVARQTFIRPRFTHVRDRVRRVYSSDDGGFIIDASVGVRFGARAVVLATGNPPPREGRLFTYSGRLADAHAGTVTIAARSGAIVELHPDWIVNCSGVGPEPVLLGFRAASDLTAFDANGNPVRGMWIVGPPVRKARFEATAVPEIRGMADTAASEVLRALRLTTSTPSLTPSLNALHFH